MKRVISFLCIILLSSILIQNSVSQIPQYYNANSGGIGNTIPFGSASVSGYKSQYLIGPNEYALPTPSPTGIITKFYFYASAAGTGTYTQLTIKMGQASITTFPVGVAYTGPMDTVYYNASPSLTGTTNAWTMITLTRPFNYNPAQSLIIEVSHCGFSGTGFNIWQIAGTTGIIRRNNIPGTPSCVFTYGGQDTRIPQTGIDVAPAGPNNFALRLPSPGVNTNYVSIPNQSGMTGFPNITIEAWVKLGATALPNTVLNKGAASFDYQLGINAGGIPFFRGPTVVATSTGLTILAGVWTHLAVTYDGANAKFYKDGLLVSTVASVMTLGSSTNEMRIGRGNNDPGSGNLEELRLWAVTRTAGAIDSNKCRKFPSSFNNSTGLRALWHLDSNYVDSVSSFNGTPLGNVGFDTVSFPIPGANCNLVGITPVGNIIPSVYILEQNYPNPFNPQTNITFSIPKGGFVEMNVYDVLGRLVTTLVRDPYEAGTYKVEFNAGNLSSGVYFYTLYVNDFSITKKMLLIK